jgi:hypothetical protein
LVATCLSAADAVQAFITANPKTAPVGVSFAAAAAAIIPGHTCTALGTATSGLIDVVTCVEAITPLLSCQHSGDMAQQRQGLGICELLLQPAATAQAVAAEGT